MRKEKQARRSSHRRQPSPKREQPKTPSMRNRKKRMRPKTLPRRTLPSSSSSKRRPRNRTSKTPPLFTWRMFLLKKYRARKPRSQPGQWRKLKGRTGRHRRVLPLNQRRNLTSPSKRAKGGLRASSTPRRSLVVRRSRRKLTRRQSIRCLI